MSYLGNPIISTDFPKDTFSGNGSTTAFTMSIAPASVNAVIVIVSGVTQDPSTYTISGTTLTFSAAPPTGTNNISVRHLGVAGTPQVPALGSVVNASMSTGAPYWDTSGNVGVGTTSPSSYGKLATVGTNTSSALLAVRDEGTSTGNLFIVSSNAVGTIARVNSYGIGVGGAVPSSGMGISFPATQSASSDANTLDDYEEGSFTPTLGGSGNSFTYTYSANYTKTGNVVNVMISINWTAKSGTSGVTIALPFTIAGNRGGMSFGMITGSTFMSASQMLFAQLDGGTSTVNLRYSNNGASWSGFTPANMGTSGEFQITGSYIA